MAASSAAVRCAHRARGGLLCLALAWAGLHVAGCGPVTYMTRLSDARDVLAQARTENARFYAPYEYYAAHAYFDKAREEAREGQYQDAARFARRASELGGRAVDLSRQTKGLR